MGKTLKEASGNRIASNTMLLYVRMIFLMAVNLYASRIILDVLGIIDYGIYNVIGGVVILFSFLNSSMSAATQRFLSFELGNGNSFRLKKVFNTSLAVHFIIGIIIVTLAELLGSFIIKEYLVIPDDRMYAALIIYQTSIIIFFIKILQVPYSASIIANEKMNFYAYISIAESLLLLLLILLIQKIPGDKLIIYSLALLFNSCMVFLAYVIYNFQNYKETHIQFAYDRVIFTEMISFSGWSMFGSLSFVAKTQGINLLLNVFFSPAVNAARAIAVQVQSAIQSFVLNFQTAVKPQMVKSYASGNITDMINLMMLSSKYSFFLLLLLGLPILFEINYILAIWLTRIPEFTATFTIIILIETLIDSYSGPLLTAFQATGKIRKFQVIVGSIRLFNLPMAYLFLTKGFPAESVFIVSMFITLIASFVRIKLLQKLLGFDLNEFLLQYLLKSFLVGIVVALILWLITYNFPSSIYRVAIVFVTSTVLILFGIFLTMSLKEKQFLRNKLEPIKRKLK